MIEEPRWWKYAIFGDDGLLKGIKEDTPKEIKKEYEAFLEAEKKGIKL